MAYTKPIPDERKLQILMAVVAGQCRGDEPLNSTNLLFRLARMLCRVEFRGMGVCVLELQEVFREAEAMTLNARMAWRARKK